MKKKKLFMLIAGVVIAMCMCIASMSFAEPEHSDATASESKPITVPSGEAKPNDKLSGAGEETASDDVQEQESDVNGELVSIEGKSDDKDVPLGVALKNFMNSTGAAHIFSTDCSASITETDADGNIVYAQNEKGEQVPQMTKCGENHLLNCVMILIACVLLFLAIVKGFEPLLLVPIALPIYHSHIFINETTHINWATLAAQGSLIDYLYLGVKLGIYPSLIFIGVGAMTDFGPLIANPKSLLLGAAAQLGIFITFIGAVYMKNLGIEGLEFTAKQAGSIGIIGGADGPTAIYVTTKLAPELLPAIAIAAYSYMALVPVIQPPIMKALTTKKERNIVMRQLKPVSKTAKILFPIVVTAIVALIVPSATPLVGALMFGNLLRETGVTERLSKTAQNELMNIVTIFLGISVGATASAANFLNWQTLGILLLGVIAFGFGTAGGVLLAKIMNIFSKEKMNPLIGSAGVSAVPMAARVSQIVGQKENPSNFLLMHAMGANVAGVIGSAIAAGVLISMFG